MYERNRKKWEIYLENKGKVGNWTNKTLTVYTAVFKSKRAEEGFEYGNGCYGEIQREDEEQIVLYDLRYHYGKDLHRLMLENYWGENLVEAKELPKTEAVG